MCRGFRARAGRSFDIQGTGERSGGAIQAQLVQSWGMFFGLAQTWEMRSSRSGMRLNDGSSCGRLDVFRRTVRDLASESFYSMIDQSRLTFTFLALHLVHPPRDFVWYRLRTGRLSGALSDSLLRLLLMVGSRSGSIWPNLRFIKIVPTWSSEAHRSRNTELYECEQYERGHLSMFEERLRW